MPIGRWGILSRGMLPTLYTHTHLRFHHLIQGDEGLNGGFGRLRPLLAVYLKDFPDLLDEAPYLSAVSCWLAARRHLHVDKFPHDLQDPLITTRGLVRRI